MGEFDLIAKYFSKHKQLSREDIMLSIGDDCAVTQIKSGQNIVITTDTLVSGTHFLPTISPSDLAYKSVAVNLSDLAAMGSTPLWASLALTLPNIDNDWLSEFSNSLFNILDHYNVALIGGDTTKGHLSITLTVQGVLEQNQGLFRHKAQVGDLIFVSGNIGDSAAGLDLLLNYSENNYSQEEQYLIRQHLHPISQVELGKVLTSYSQCAIDISDGLIADLKHILNRSQCGAEIYIENLPLSSTLVARYGKKQAEQFALTGGEDYQLCFTISPEKLKTLEKVLMEKGFNCTCIGKITNQVNEVKLFDKGNAIILPQHIGFDHFNK
ncbi:thiamine-phosphate kinase [Otariodibacter oris]|uniref:Thiamine-monophosphate kinase n=1 Tax=Otariodibacter oris TaxID=1032623 RepID=A0A420XJK0_9PAST|nr:thiamine-phosphate kinase [Otariodibacter oris]QGM80419.1 thiamine-phosphate kinase [Otariodibacter oris]RKR77436.1 thiamine-phosphate kinase [Otariodibacter oris]